ncbi:MAG: diguanylate cyclase [Oscillospiraceae bacterium]|nr:diguanylate cyclase [Oscillospiraceae bacterium]
MHSIRTKITALTLAAILISIASFGITGIYFVIRESNRMSAQTLSLICENRKDTLNEYLNSIQQSVNMISRYAVDSLDSIALTEGGALGASGSGVQEIPGRSGAQRQALDRYFDAHLATIESAFQSIANHTNGLSACYYRINPEITTAPKGFFFSKKGLSDFQKMELTDIQAYDAEDLNRVGWYYIPLQQGRPSWLKPYLSASLGNWVISYAVPIYKAGTFIGIIGMDIKYETLVTQIQQLSDFETGYFVLTDEDGRIYYHPDYEMGTALRDVLPQVSGLVTDARPESSPKELNRYEKNGAKWQMAYSTLANDMRLAAVVKVSEINTTSQTLTKVFLTAGALILLAFAVITTVTMKHVTDPLQRLTAAARRLAAGDYDAELDCRSSDEVGVLTDTFRSMRDTLKVHFNELSSKVFTDDLTGVKSKHAYVEAVERLDRRIRDGAVTEFAMVLFDLNDLKRINDTRGHDAGDRYIREACSIICTRFKHSPVYRIGGDEFVAILEGTDYETRGEAMAAFEKEMDENLDQGKLTVASGAACFDPAADVSSQTVFRRADKRMYQRKEQMKEKNHPAQHKSENSRKNDG